MILFFITTLSSVLTIFLWMKDEWKISNKTRYKLLYPLFFIILSIFSITQYFEIREMQKIVKEAVIVSKSWPESSYVKYLSKGERLGIILAGQTFLEKHKNEIPDTYADFQALKKGRLGDYTPKETFSDKMDEYNNMEDVCSATITIIKNLAHK